MRYRIEYSSAFPQHRQGLHDGGGVHTAREKNAIADIRPAMDINGIEQGFFQMQQGGCFVFDARRLREMAGRRKDDVFTPCSYTAFSRL